MSLHLIECDGCGRNFSTEDPQGMLAAIVGSCPMCSGRFKLAVPVSTSQPGPSPSRGSG